MVKGCKGFCTSPNLPSQLLSTASPNMYTRNNGELLLFLVPPNYCSSGVNDLKDRVWSWAARVRVSGLGNSITDAFAEYPYRFFDVGDWVMLKVWYYSLAILGCLNFERSIDLPQQIKYLQSQAYYFIVVDLQERDIEPWVRLLSNLNLLEDQLQCSGYKAPRARLEIACVYGFDIFLLRVSLTSDGVCFAGSRLAT